jgi:predicted HNH restriction endonuclease
LRFDGDKAPVFKAGTLDTQTLRGIRELTPASARLLANLLESARQQGRQTAAMFPNEIEFEREYIEGACKQVTVNAYEREPKARKVCLEHHGFDCAVCGFNFEAKYGERGKDFIHVHHLKPMALTDGEYALNPVTDLRPVCPNCHAMLHRGEEVLSIEELCAILTQLNTTALS